MEKTSERDALASVKSSANSISFEATNVAMNPPALQLKSEVSSLKKEESSEVDSTNSPFQFVADDTPPPPIQNKSNNAPFQFKSNPELTDADGQEERIDSQPYQLAAEGGGNPPESPASGAGSDDGASNNTGLPNQLKSGIENLSGFSLDDVQVHRNSDKPAQLQAHAFAQGTDIHLGPGQEEHLPHEAWHVVQQKQGRVQPTKQLKAFNINDDSSLEREADVMGAKAMTAHASESRTSATKMSPINAKTPDNLVQRVDFEDDPDYGKNLMNEKTLMIWSRLHMKLKNEGDSLDHFDEIAELLAMLFPYQDPATRNLIGKNEVDLAIQMAGMVESKFKNQDLRSLYLKSMLVSNNGTELGEPSVLQRAMLASGMLSSANVNGDLDYIISIFENASSEELVEFKDSSQIRRILGILRVRSNYSATSTHTTEAKIEYLEKHIYNKTKDYTPVTGTNETETEENAAAKQRENVEDKSNEGILLIKSLTSKLGRWNKGKLLKKNAAVERIREWAQSLTPEQRSHIVSASSTLCTYLNSGVIESEYSAYILSLFNSREVSDDYSEGEQATDESTMFISYLDSKRIGSGTASKKFSSILEFAENMSLASKIRVLERKTPHKNLTTDYQKRAAAVETFKGKLKTYWNIKGTDRDLLINLFSWGAESNAGVKNGPLHKIQQIAHNTSIDATKYGKKLLPHVRKLNPADILQILKSPLWGKLHYLKHGRGNTAEFASVATILGMDLERESRLDSRHKMPEQEEKDLVVDRLELNPNYWATKIELSIGDRSIMNKNMLRRNKNEIISLISQAFYAGQRATKSEPGKFPTIAHFTQAVKTNISREHQGFIEDSLSAGNYSLVEGKPVAASDRLDIAKLKSPLKRARGYNMKTSAVVQSIIDAQGRELLNEWSDFPSFVSRIKKYTTEKKKAEVIAYIPDVNRSLLDRIKEALPAEEYSNIHRDLLLKMALALKTDDRFKEMLESIGSDFLTIRSEMLKSLGLLNREQIVDTGWQMKYFSAKGPMRKEAKRIVLHRLRKAKKAVITSDSDEMPDIEAALAQANENLEDRTEVFADMKAKAIKAIMFTISIIIGVLTTVGSLGVAGPLVAAGLPTLLVSFMVSTIFTGIASSIKMVVERQLTGGSFNTAEGVFNIFKDILMAATTVAAGQVGEQAMEGWKLTPGIMKIFQAAEADGASVGSRILYSFVEKFLAVSPVEVAMRNITEGLITNFSAVESVERERITWKEMGGFVRDFTIDALLKTTMDMIGTDMLGVVNSGAETGTFTTSAGVKVDYESIGPMLQNISAGQLIAIIAAENFITSQNYSVAEQDSIVGNLIVDRISGFLSDKISNLGLPDKDHVKSEVSSAPKMALKEKLKNLPLGLIVDKFLNTEELVSIVLSSNPSMDPRVSIGKLQVSSDKLIDIVAAFQMEGFSVNHIRAYFGLPFKMSVPIDVEDDLGSEGSSTSEVADEDGDIFHDALDRLDEDMVDVPDAINLPSHRDVSEAVYTFDADLRPNPNLYKNTLSADGQVEQYKVSNSSPGDEWALITQFCTYMSVYWLLNPTEEGLKFDDFENKKYAAETIRSFTLDQQPAYAAENIGGITLSKDRMLSIISRIAGSANEANLKIWFGNDVHTESAVLTSEKKFLHYDPNTGNCVVKTPVEMMLYLEGKDVFVSNLDPKEKKVHDE